MVKPKYFIVSIKRQKLSKEKGEETKEAKRYPVHKFIVNSEIWPLGKYWTRNTLKNRPKNRAFYMLRILIVTNMCLVQSHLIFN